MYIEKSMFHKPKSEIPNFSLSIIVQETRQPNSDEISKVYSLKIQMKTT